MIGEPQSSLGATLTITPQPGYAIAWTGTEGQFANGPVPDNLALASNGATPFGSGEFGGVHFITDANNGLYGNSNAWISNSADSPPYIGVALAGGSYIDRVAWSRTNVTFGDPCGGGVCLDRSLGTYTLQYTNVVSPGVATPVTGNATTGWATIGTVTYGAGAGPIAQEWQRHEYFITEADGDSLVATGFRLQVSTAGGQAIAELEIFQGLAPVPEPAACTLLGFGLVVLAGSIRRSRNRFTGVTP